MQSGFIWRGQWYAIDAGELLERAAEALQRDRPAEAFRYQDWAIAVDGQPVNVKWLFALATGARYSEFDSPTARRVLGEIGLNAYPINRGDERVEPSAVAGPGPSFAGCGDFLHRIAEHLGERLAAASRPAEFVFRSNYVQVRFPEYGGSHYQLTLGRAGDDFGLHFESTHEASRARVAVFEPEVRRLSEAMGRLVTSGAMGPNWAHVSMVIESAAWTHGQANRNADLMFRFIDVTRDLLQEAYARKPAFGRARRTERPESGTEARPVGDAHALLNAQICRIRAFLTGRASRPSDEVLCDWVTFCYGFGLFSEGGRVFDCIDRQAVNDWYYGRTQKLARACKLRCEREGE